MRTLRMPESKCPYCEHLLDACTALNSLDSPSRGDLTVCVRCGGFLQFDQDLNLQKPHPLELASFVLNQPEDYQELVWMSQAFRQVSGGDRP